MGKFRPMAAPITVQCVSHEQLVVVAGYLDWINDARIEPCVAVTSDDGSTIVMQTVVEANRLVAAIMSAARIAFAQS